MYTIVEDDLSGAEIHNLLDDHQKRMAEHSPPESRHVLDIKALKQPGIIFWSMWKGGDLVGCVALKHWDDDLAEIKSMKTSPDVIRQGIGKLLLKHVVKIAKQKGYNVLKLETGSMTYFAAARALYLSNGFQYCEPFGHYQADKNSVFMSFTLS